MPELGKYAVPVLMSYAVAIGLLLVLLGVSLRRSRRVRDTLRAVEERQARGDG